MAGLNDDRGLLLECFLRTGYDEELAARAYEFIMRMEGGDVTTSSGDGAEEARPVYIEPETGFGYDVIGEFEDGVAMVRRGIKYNYIRDDGSVVSDVWFDSVDEGYYGLHQVELGGKYNFLRNDGGLVSEEWFDGVYGCMSGGLIRVRIGGDYLLMDKDGKFRKLENVAPIDMEVKPKPSWDECWQESKRMVDDILESTTGGAIKVY